MSARIDSGEGTGTLSSARACLSLDAEASGIQFLGDTITAEGEIVSVHPTKPVTQLKMRVSRQTCETVLEGEAWCYTFSGNTAADRRVAGS